MPNNDDALTTLMKRIEKLEPPEALRLAAELMERGKIDLGISIAGRVIDELRLVMQLNQLKPKSRA